MITEQQITADLRRFVANALDHYGARVNVADMSPGRILVRGVKSDDGRDYTFVVNILEVRPTSADYETTD